MCEPRGAGGIASHTSPGRIRRLNAYWFPLAMGLLVFMVLMTWRRGEDIVTRNRKEEGSLREFVVELASSPDPPIRVPGTAVFLNASATTTPLALRYNVEHNRVLHEHVVVCTIQTVGVPHVPAEERVVIDDLSIPDDGISLVTARFGFQDEPNVPLALRLARDHGLDIDVEDASYFLSRITIAPTRKPGMAMWRKRLFHAISRHAASHVNYFCLPEDRVIALGRASRCSGGRSTRRSQPLTARREGKPPARSGASALSSAGAGRPGVLPGAKGVAQCATA